MTRGASWIRFTLRATWPEWRRLILRVGGALFLVFVVTFVAAVEITSQPIFCGNACHIMDPYYQSWKTSAHKDVTCVDCHMTPGIKGTYKAKLQGLSQLAKYFTGTAGTKPWAEVDDASCLRSDCHETRVLEGRVTFKGVHFDHKPHLTDLKRGKKLKCTSCHSQVAMGDHLTVTISTCVLCHFKNKPKPTSDSECLTCHTIPDSDIVLPGNRIFQHRSITDRGVACNSCHATVTSGDGFVPRSRCFTCHNISIDTYLVQPDFLHQKHVTEHKVECMDCHEEMTHGYESKRRVANDDCALCHSGQHTAEISLAEGTVAAVLGETEARVGPMLAARVECIGCHIDVRNNNDRDTYDGQTRHGGKQACVNCHGEMARDLLPNWKEFFGRRISEVERAIRSSRENLSARNRARDLLERVRSGRAVHNPTLARDMLLEAERLATGGPDRAAKEPLGQAEADKGLKCRYCHIEAPRGSINFNGAAFLHEPHTMKMRLPCEKCHEASPATFPDGPHGGVKLTKNDCATCHHWQVKTCAPCHGSGPGGPMPFAGIAFQHARHTAAKVECKTCHMRTIRGELRLSAIGISDCASCHHRPGHPGKCETCHKVSDGPAPIPETVKFRNAQVPHRNHIELGVECRDCHKTAGRGTEINPVCLTCHHEDGMKPSCEACHGTGPTEPVPTAWKPFPHQKHAPIGLTCADCHSKADPAKVEAPCATCHEEAAAPAAAPTDSPAASGAEVAQ